MAEQKTIEYVFQGSGLDEKEKTWGKKRFKDYRTSYPHLEKMASLIILEELVWKETMQERFKRQIGQLGEDSKKKNTDSNKIEAIPKFLQESMSDGLAQIIDLKNKLGMFDDQEKTDEFKNFQSLRDKAAEYRKSHSLSFRTTCPHCARPFYLKRKTECYEEFKSPFAEDRVIKNDELHSDYLKGLFPKERYAKYLGVSVDYIDWLDEKIYRNVTKKADAVDTTTPTPEVNPATDSTEQK